MTKQKSHKWRDTFIGILIAILAGLAVMGAHYVMYDRSVNKEDLFQTAKGQYRLEGDYHYEMASSSKDANAIAMVVWPVSQDAVKIDINNDHYLYVLYTRNFPKIGKYGQPDSIGVTDDGLADGIDPGQYMVVSEKTYDSGKFLYSTNPDRVSSVVITDGDTKKNISVDPDHPFVRYIGSEDAQIKLVTEDGKMIPDNQITYREDNGSGIVQDE